MDRKNENERYEKLLRYILNILSNMHRHLESDLPAPKKLLNDALDNCIQEINQAIPKEDSREKTE